MLKKLKETISTRNRMRKFKSVCEHIYPDDKIIDIGVDPSLGGNTNYFEKWYNLPNSLTCLGVNSDFTEFRKTFPYFELIEFDGKNFPTFDTKFNLGFSNAVIEHVGDRSKQIIWLSNIAQITEKLIITTPNRWLPFETHSMTFFIHWLPLNLRNWIYRRIGKAHFAEDYMWLLGANDFKYVLKKAGFSIEEFHCNRFLGFTIDFVAVCKVKYNH